MLSLLLQRSSGNWLPFLVLLVAMLLIIKGTEVLFAYVKKWMHRKDYPPKSPGKGLEGHTAE